MLEKIHNPSDIQNLISVNDDVMRDLIKVINTL